MTCRTDGFRKMFQMFDAGASTLAHSGYADRSLGWLILFACRFGIISSRNANLISCRYAVLSVFTVLSALR